MVSTSKLPKHTMSITRPKAQHDFTCCWYGCGKAIPKGQVYVRVVWEDDEGEFHSDHVCVDCWEKPA